MFFHCRLCDEGKVLKGTEECKKHLKTGHLVWSINYISKELNLTMKLYGWDYSIRLKLQFFVSFIIVLFAKGTIESPIDLFSPF